MKVKERVFPNPSILTKKKMSKRKRDRKHFIINIRIFLAILKNSTEREPLSHAMNNKFLRFSLVLRGFLAAHFLIKSVHE